MKTTAGSLRKGDFIKNNDDITQIVKTEHNMRGRGSATLRFKVKSVANGNTVELTFKPDNMVEAVQVDSVQMAYLYGNAESLTFMNNQTYEQAEVPRAMVGDFVNYMKEGQLVYVIFHEGKAIAARAPTSVILGVTEAEDAVKGDTASSARKAVIVETGARVMVPLFIRKGERIVVNPESGEYVERG